MPRARRAAAALLVLALAATGCSDDGDAGPPSTTEGRTTRSTESTTTTEPLQGKPLVVAEQGVSSFPDPVDPNETLGGYGVVLHNPNKRLMATGVRVVTRVLDPAGAELLVDSTLLNGILPQHRMAVGRTLIEPIRDPTRLEVSVEVTAWLPPASAEGRLTSADVVTEPEEAGGSVTRYRVESTWPELEEGVDVTAVYRAADGRILGAEVGIIDVPAGDSAEGSIRLLSPIPDLASTEVFVGRGFAALTTG